jgi:hypothetical protein
MKSRQVHALITGVAAFTIGIYVEIGTHLNSEDGKKNSADAAVSKGLKWLVSTQGNDGGWGQDGGETSYVRQGERLESNGNDVANTAVVALALLHSGTGVNRGEYRPAMRRALGFILEQVEQSPEEGLAITDTFLTSKLLAELDGTMGSTQENARVRRALKKCVAKIEKNQMKDGSWNISGGWAPILGTSMASQSLAVAHAKGATNSQIALDKVEQYTKVQVAAPATSETMMVSGSASAGVPLYQSAQELEQISRSDADRKKNAKRIEAITSRLSNQQFVTGFGSIGGEEFFSWLNISDSLHRTGGNDWQKWNGDMKTKLIKLQNEDGTWAGHHCITGRVAVTGAAILLLTSDREPAPASNETSMKQHP